MTLKTWFEKVRMLLKEFEIKIRPEDTMELLSKMIETDEKLVVRAHCETHEFEKDFHFDTDPNYFAVKVIDSMQAQFRDILDGHAAEIKDYEYREQKYKNLKQEILDNANKEK